MMIISQKTNLQYYIPFQKDQSQLCSMAKEDMAGISVWENDC